MSRPSGEALTTYISAALLVVFVIIIYALLPSNTLAFALGIPAGALAGFLVTLGTYFLQQPNFVLRAADDKYDSNSGPWFFTHVLVKNTSRGFLGGGIATDCRGQLTVGKTTFTPKWASRPEPLSWHPIPTGPNTAAMVPWIEWGRMEESKTEALGPGDERPLDVVVKVKDDENAYVHEPENYRHPLHKKEPPSEGILAPDTYVLTLVLAYRGGKSKPFKIQVKNLKSTAPESVSICVLP